MQTKSLLATALALVLAACPAAADLTTGLVAHYPFQGNADDASGNGNHGTPTATTVLTSDRFGTANGAYLFNGRDTQILVPSSASLSSPTSQITMCAWILLQGNSQVGGAFWPLLMKSNTTENGFMYRVSGDLTGFGAAFNNWNTQLGSAYGFSLNTWTFVAVTYDGAFERQYVNGVLNGQQPRTLAIVADTRPLVIGGDTPGVYESFWGKIDDVRIYNRALSAAEIFELSRQTVGVADAGNARGIMLRAPSPNPGTRAGQVEFTLPAAMDVELTVSDVQGRCVRTLLSGARGAGSHVARWDGYDAAGRAAKPGVYFWRLRFAGGQVTQRWVRLQ